MAEDLEKLLEQFSRDIGAHVDESADGLRGRIDELQSQTDSRFREVFSHFDALYTRFDKAGDELQALSAAVSRLETRSLSRAEFEREVEQIRGKIGHLQHRLDDLEKMHREN